jgi:hypothetical protein
MKNLITLMSCVLFSCVLLFAGCSGGGGSSGGGDGTSPATSPLTTTATKRSAVIYPNAASPIYYVDSAPDGTGIVARRGASGGISSMDIISTDGIYYQLAWGSTGLPSMTVAGYQFTVLASDASGNVTQMKVTNPSGISKTYNNKYAVGKIAELADSVSPGHKITYFGGAGNPECGSQAIDSPDFPGSFACSMALDGYAPLHIVNNLCNWIADAPAAVADLWQDAKDKAAAFGKKVLPAVILEQTQLGKDISDYKNTDSSKTNLAYSTDTNNPAGTPENSARNLFADAKMLANDPQANNLSTINASKLKFLSPDPVVNSVTPAVATLNQNTVFSVNGANLKYGQLGFALENCYGISETKAAGSNPESTTERRFSCMPTKPGPLKGQVTNYADGSNALLKSFSVVVGGNTLPAPTNFKVTKTGDMSWQMTWDAVAGATEYYVFQKSGSAPSVTSGRVNWNTLNYFDFIPKATAPSDTGVVDQAGTYYWVVVAASYDESNLDYVNLGKASTAANLTFTAAAPTATGRVSIWTDNSTTISSVYVDNAIVGSLSTYFSNGAPSCGQSGTITQTLPVGTHTIKASNSKQSWASTNVTITANNCTMFKLSGTNTPPADVTPPPTSGGTCAPSGCGTPGTIIMKSPLTIESAPLACRAAPRLAAISMQSVGAPNALSFQQHCIAATNSAGYNKSACYCGVETINGDSDNRCYVYFDKTSCGN